MSNEDKSETKNKVKSKGLFDHISHIRLEKSPNYVNGLSESELKTFNPFMLVMGLGMDRANLESMMVVSKYIDIIPQEHLYTLLCHLTGKTNKRYIPWIKSKSLKLDAELLNVMTKYLKCSRREAYETLLMMLSNDDGIKELIEVCKKYGMNEAEIQKLIINE